MMGVPSAKMRLLLRLEGAAIAIAIIALVWADPPSWWVIVAVLVAPDLAMVAYAAGTKIGAAAYNATHSYIGPVVLGVLVWGTTFQMIAVQRVLHIAADRAIGYGLKYGTGFKDTHLGAISGASRDV